MRIFQTYSTGTVQRHSVKMSLICKIHDIRTQARKKELQWSCTSCSHHEKQLLRHNAASHWPNKLVCYIWINNLTWCKNSLFDSSRCRHGLLFNVFLNSSQRYWMRFRSGFFHCHGLIDISFHGHLFSVPWYPLLMKDKISNAKLSPILNIVNSRLDGKWYVCLMYAYVCLCMLMYVNSPKRYERALRWRFYFLVRWGTMSQRKEPDGKRYQSVHGYKRILT